MLRRILVPLSALFAVALMISGCANPFTGSSSTHYGLEEDTLYPLAVGEDNDFVKFFDKDGYSVLIEIQRWEPTPNIRYVVTLHEGESYRIDNNINLMVHPNGIVPRTNIDFHISNDNGTVYSLASIRFDFADSLGKSANIRDYIDSAHMDIYVNQEQATALGL
jgi:hypothetical protein